MWKPHRLLIIGLCVGGFAQTGHTASFDFSFQNAGISYGQGSFSFPDADLSQPYVGVSQFTSFSLVTGGATFGLADLRIGSYLPSTNKFSFTELSPNGFGYVINAAYNPTPAVLEFYVSGSQYEPCYYNGLCGPEYPPVFNGYYISVGTFDFRNGYTQQYGNFFTDFLITPSISTVPEPSTASLLSASLIGLGLLARRRIRSM